MLTLDYNLHSIFKTWRRDIISEERYLDRIDEVFVAGHGISQYQCSWKSRTVVWNKLRKKSERCWEGADCNNYWWISNIPLPSKCDPFNSFAYFNLKIPDKCRTSVVYSFNQDCWFLRLSCPTDCVWGEKKWVIWCATTTTEYEGVVHLKMNEDYFEN